MHTRVASSTLSRHPKTCNKSVNERLRAINHEVAAFLLANIAVAEKLDFDKSNEIVLFKKNNYDVHKVVASTPKPLQMGVNVLP